MQVVRVLRGVALFEAAKGLLVLTAGFGLLSMLHENVEHLAEHWIRHLHFDPASHYPRIFLDLAGHLHDHTLWALASFAALYAGVRFIEAYGLWNGRAWAEWFAALSGGIYLPIELRQVVLKGSVISTAMFIVNLAIVLFMVYTLRQSRANARVSSGEPAPP